VKFNRPEKRNSMSPKLNRQMLRVIEPIASYARSNPQNQAVTDLETGRRHTYAELPDVAGNAVVGVPDERRGDAGNRL